MTTFVYATEVGIAPREEKFYLKPMQLSHVSQTGVKTDIDLSATRWWVEWLLQPETVAQARSLETLIDRMAADPSHRLQVYPYGYAKQGGAQGSWGGTPVVAGGSQTGTSLNGDGATGTTGYGVAGDLFAVNGELKRVATDFNASAASPTNTFTVSFVPALRAAPADNDSITVSNPSIVCQLVEYDIPRNFTPGGVNFEPVRLVLMEDIS